MDEFSPIFPSVIEGYDFEKEVDAISGNKYRFAIYRNMSGEKAFAKMWVKGGGRLKRYWLKNEVKVGQFLNDNKAFKGSVRTPRLIGVFSDKTREIIMSEYLAGQDISSLPAEQKVQVVSDALRELSKVHSSKGFSWLPVKKRSPLYYSLLLYPLSVLAIIRKPAWSLLIAKSVLSFFRSQGRFLQAREKEFVHRDLTDKNILMAGKSYYLVDFQIAVVSHPFADLSALLINRWHETDFKERFVSSSFYQKALESNRRVLRSHFIYHGISEIALYGNQSAETVRDYLVFANNI